jgi:hypothetical protein
MGGHPAFHFIFILYDVVSSTCPNSPQQHLIHSVLQELQFISIDEFTGHVGTIPDNNRAQSLGERGRYWRRRNGYAIDVRNSSI